MKILCILTDGFEELEAVGTIALLRRAGICVDVFAIDANKASGRFNLELSSLNDVSDAILDDYGMLFLPGGPHYAKLELTPRVLDILDIFIKEHKYIAAICAAPTILGRAGYLNDKKYTCFTSMNEDFGGTYVDVSAIQDGQLITARSVAAVFDFSFLIIETLQGTEKLEEIKASIYY